MHFFPARVSTFLRFRFISVAPPSHLPPDRFPRLFIFTNIRTFSTKNRYTRTSFQNIELQRVRKYKKFSTVFQLKKIKEIQQTRAYNLGFERDTNALSFEFSSKKVSRDFTRARSRPLNDEDIYQWNYETTTRRCVRLDEITRIKARLVATLHDETLTGFSQSAVIPCDENVTSSQKWGQSTPSPFSFTRQETPKVKVWNPVRNFKLRQSSFYGQSL